MAEFYVKYEGCYCIRSKVYAVDTVRHEFLIVDNYDNFKWVPTDDCELITKAEAGYYDD
jgi:hypothetical protein